MKKAILTSIAFLAMYSAYAQNNNNNSDIVTDRNRSVFGVKGGLNVSTFYVGTERVSSEKYRIGGNAGFFGYAAITSFFGVQTEILFSGKGTRISQYQDAVGVNSGQVNFNLHYLEVPIFAKFNLGPIGIGAGLYGDYLLDANMSNISYRSDIPDVKRYDINDKDFNKFDIGGLLDVSINTKTLIAGLRYTEGFRTVASTTTGEVFLGNSKNSVISAYIGIDF